MEELKKEKGQSKHGEERMHGRVNLSKIIGKNTKIWAQLVYRRSTKQR